MNIFNFRIKLLFPAVLLFITNIINGQQSQWQNWNSVGLKMPVSKTIDFKISELVAFSPSNAFTINFAQTSGAISVDLTKKLNINFGDQLTYIPGSTNALRNRIFLKGSLENKFSKLIKAEHSLQAEIHSKSESRYRQRYIFINSLSLRRRFSALNLRPSVSYFLYYNVGGSPLQYYDESGNPTVIQTPDGFHRGRLYARLNSRITSNVQLTLYYMNQSEFNFLTSADKIINVQNPSTGKIVRPFDQYNVAGLSLLFSVKRDN